ncbi:UDP-N-acetylmuramoyl-tripeptide--D-alanyl-D-alanine ligase [Nonomuraea sp. KM88]|uniref:UDP-N-acetylmuramoyl-tripeptide--D-alanyl-D- alanine ligase n=1 Tax=Nonomuraea sp. KM88 TaxID=3457427 RepID=UPI003FCCF1F3
MIPLPLARIAEITSGALSGMADPRAVVRGPVVIDSRAVEPGSLFVAFKGARVDGHDYAAQAIRAGAVAVLATRPVEAPAVIVPDAAAALAALAAEQVRALPQVTVIGVTGSAGKTGTKDLLARLTGRIGPAIAPVGSFNNELGHPLTVLRADADTRFMVLELAARNIGHIKDLTRIAPPQIGVVLNVGTAHLGVFGGKEAIAKAKGELVEALPRTGVAVLNADDPLVRAMATRTDARVTYFGRGESAAIRAEGVVLDARGRASFTLRTPSGSAHVSLKLYGEHAVENALAAAAAGYELGLPVATIAAELSEATPRSRWRMEVNDRPDGVTVVNDAYNANPDSMRAAFEAFEVLGRGRRRFAVIAALRELGDDGPALNAELGRLAGGAGLAGLIVAGPDAEPVLQGAHTAAQATTTARALPPPPGPRTPGPQGAGGPGAGPGPGPQGVAPQAAGPQGAGGPVTCPRPVRPQSVGPITFPQMAAGPVTGPQAAGPAGPQSAGPQVPGPHPPAGPSRGRQSPAQGEPAPGRQAPGQGEATQEWQGGGAARPARQGPAHGVPAHGWHGSGAGQAPVPPSGGHSAEGVPAAGPPSGGPQVAPLAGAPAGAPPAGVPGAPAGVPGAPAGSTGGDAACPQHVTRIVHVPDAEAAAAELAGWLRQGDAVLIKGPRAMGLERTAELVLGGAPQ